MNTNKRGTRRASVVMLFSALVIAGGLFFGPGVGAAQAQSSSDPCAIEQFIGANNEVDLVAYAACVEGQNALARTGTDVGQYVGIGSGLIALGAAFVWSSRRTRQNTAV